MGRRELEENMVITLEPGIYFIRQLLEPALQNPKTARFFNKGRVEEYFDFGGGPCSSRHLTADPG